MPPGVATLIQDSGATREDLVIRPQRHTRDTYLSSRNSIFSALFEWEADLLWRLAGQGGKHFRIPRHIHWYSDNPARTMTCHMGRLAATRGDLWKELGFGFGFGLKASVKGRELIGMRSSKSCRPADHSTCLNPDSAGLGLGLG